MRRAEPPDRPLVLSSDTRDSILRHARAALPAEAVGVLGGRPDDGRAVVAVPLPNLAGTRPAFFADPRAQYEAEKELRRLGLTVLAAYHSHPGGGAALSPVDEAFAAYLPLAQVVIALARPRPPLEEMRAYRLEAGRTLEVELRIG